MKHVFCNLTICLAIATATTIAGCTVKKQYTNPTQVIREGGGSPAVRPPNNNGNASGGGGTYGDYKGNLLLDLAKKDLIKKLRMSPKAIVGFPADWNMERVIKVIETIRENKEEQAKRDGIELTFNNVIEPSGTTYLVAQKLFYVQAGSHPLDIWLDDAKRGLGYSELGDITLQTEAEILHEISHFLGIGTTRETDSLAKDFGLALKHNLDKDDVICEALLKNVKSILGKYTVELNLAHSETKREAVCFSFNPISGNGEMVLCKDTVANINRKFYEREPNLTSISRPMASQELRYELNWGRINFNSKGDFIIGSSVISALEYFDTKTYAQLSLSLENNVGTAKMSFQEKNQSNEVIAQGVDEYQCVRTQYSVNINDYK